MASAMFLKDGTTLRPSAIRELSFEKHAEGGVAKLSLELLPFTPEHVTGW